MRQWQSPKRIAIVDPREELIRLADAVIRRGDPEGFELWNRKYAEYLTDKAMSWTEERFSKGRDSEQNFTKPSPPETTTST